SAKPNRSTRSPFAASATPNTAAALTGVTVDLAETGRELIDADVSTRTRVRPGSAGRFDSDACIAQSSGCPHRSDGADSYADRNRNGRGRERTTAGAARHPGAH